MSAVIRLGVDQSAPNSSYQVGIGEKGSDILSRQHLPTGNMFISRFDGPASCNSGMLLFEFRNEILHCQSIGLKFLAASVDVGLDC